MKNKILIHVAKENEYISFIQNLNVGVSENDEIIAVSVHGNLFELFYAHKPNIVILPAHEYTQEFHDFINEHNKTIKIIIFINTNIKDEQIIEYWHLNKLILAGKKEYLITKSENPLLYSKLYDSNIFNRISPEKPRNDKIAVMLSENNEKNIEIISPLLYPYSNERLVLFNSITYNPPQNVGVLNQYDACLILNSYQSLIDLDDKYSIEAQVCEIDNLQTENDLSHNITNKILKKTQYDLDTSSFKYYIQNQFLPTILEG
jgi:hypothetical protein